MSSQFLTKQPTPEDITEKRGPVEIDWVNTSLGLTGVRPSTSI